MRASFKLIANKNQDASMLIVNKKSSYQSELNMKDRPNFRVQARKSCGCSNSPLVETAIALSLAILICLTANQSGSLSVDASTLSNRMNNRDVDILMPSESRLRIVTNAKPVIENASSTEANDGSEKAASTSASSIGLFDRLAKLRESLQRRDRFKDLHESLKERIGGIRGARSTADKVYKLNINLPVTKGTHDDHNGAESKNTNSITTASVGMMHNIPLGRVIEQKVDSTSSAGTNKLVKYDDNLQDNESIRRKFFTPLLDNDASLMQSSSFNPQFDHLATNLADSLFGFYPASRGQRTPRSVDLTPGGPYDSLASSPMVAHESPNMMSLGQDSILPFSVMTGGSSSSSPPAPLPSTLQSSLQQMQHGMENGAQSKVSQHRHHEQQVDLPNSDTIWPTPAGEPFGFSTPSSSGFGQRSSPSPGKVGINQRIQDINEDRSVIPANAARLDNFVGQDLSSNAIKEPSMPLENGGNDQEKLRAQTSDPMRMASEEEYSMKSNEGDYEEHGAMHDEAYKKSPKKIDRYYSEEESHDSYESHAPKKVIIKKEEKHHHHHHHHHHHEPEKKEDHKKHEKVHVQSQPLHLEIHIKGKSKSKMKSKGKGKGKDKSKGKNKDGDEIYVKLNQGGGHHSGHGGGHHGGYHMDSGGHGGDDGSYVEDEKSSGHGMIEDKKSLLEEEPSSAGGDDGGSTDSPSPVKTQAMKTVAAEQPNEQEQPVEGSNVEGEQQSGESKSNKEVDQGSHFDANHVINTSEVPKYFDIFGEELNNHHEKKPEEKDHGGEHQKNEEVKESSEGSGEKGAVAENQGGGEAQGEESKENKEENHQPKKHKKVEKKKKKKKEKKIEKVVVEEKKPVEHEEKVVEQEEKKEEHEEKKEEKKEEKQEEKKEEKHEKPKKEKESHHKSKHAHIEVHKHNHYEHHEHINLEQKPELEHHQQQPEMHHHPEIEQHHEHMDGHEHADIGGHHQFEEGMHHQEHHGGYEAPMMHHHDPEHHQPIKEHWVAPVIHEKPSNEHHPHGAIIIEDHSLLEKHNIEHPEGAFYKEEVVNHPHGFGLTPSAAYNLMGAHSTQSITQSDRGKSGGNDQTESNHKQPSGNKRDTDENNTKKTTNKQKQ